MTIVDLGKGDAGTWDDTFAVGNAMFDGQHQLLARLVDALCGALGRRASHAETRALFEALLTHTRSHFRAEEAWMLATDYPESDEHRRRHGALLDILLAARNRLVGDAEAIDEDFCLYLRSWLLAHIDTEDRRMAVWVAGNAA